MVGNMAYAQFGANATRSHKGRKIVCPVGDSVHNARTLASPDSPAHMATLTETHLGKHIVIRLAGGLTFDGVGPISRQFDALTTSGSVIIELAGVTIITTPGLSLLLSALKRLQHHGGQLILAGPSTNVREVLRRCRLDRVFTLADDEPAAQRMLEEHTRAQSA